EPILERLPSAGWHLGYYIGLLGEIGDQRAVAPLRAMLVTADERLRPMLRAVLIKLGQDV
ncbi:MAG: hypothetical protein ABI700_23905, partial [Chloroflexota bacterium]